MLLVEILLSVCVRRAWVYVHTRAREEKSFMGSALFSEFHPHVMYCFAGEVSEERTRVWGEIKIYGCDGSIIQFSVFMAHFGRFSPHSIERRKTLFGIFAPGFPPLVCRM